MVTIGQAERPGQSTVVLEPALLYPATDAIAEVEDKVIWLEVAPEVELKISKGAVAEIVTDEDDDENDDEGADDLAAGDADA